MSRSYTVKTSVVACLVFLKNKDWLIEAQIFTRNITYKSIVKRVKYTCCDSNFRCMVSGHIDVYSNIKRFNCIF